MRTLARKFRDHAARTKLEKYFELLSHTAEDLEREAEALEGERHEGERHGQHFDFYA